MSREWTIIDQLILGVDDISEMKSGKADTLVNVAAILSCFWCRKIRFRSRNDYVSSNFLQEHDMENSG